VGTYFTDLFGVDPRVLETRGALDISLITDLPLFIDPFLLFNSKKAEYRKLHDQVIEYLVFLRDKARAGNVSEPMLRSWYCFPEVKQTWLGFSETGNKGSGLGIDFARSLHLNLHRIFLEFGEEQITKGSHREKVCLVRDGVGRDNVSDFVTNLIKDFLCRYTQSIAEEVLDVDRRREVAISKAVFNFTTEVWEPKRYILPWIDNDYVVLTPKDLLTRDDNWINKGDLIRAFDEIPTAIPDEQLRFQVSNYFHGILSSRKRKQGPTQKEYAEAASRTLMQFPDLIDYYIRLKESQGHKATSISSLKVKESERLFIIQLKELQDLLSATTPFYTSRDNTYEEAHKRLAYLKDVIENKGGHRLFYNAGKPVQREKDLQILYRLVWIGTPSDVSTEVDDGRGPADVKVSRGTEDKTIIEMKLAKNSHLKQNLAKQTDIYQKASDAQNAIKAIMFFSEEEEGRVGGILKELKMTGSRDIVLIDARRHNKPSGSKA